MPHGLAARSSTQVADLVDDVQAVTTVAKPRRPGARTDHRVEDLAGIADLSQTNAVASCHIRSVPGAPVWLTVLLAASLTGDREIFGSAPETDLRSRPAPEPGGGAPAESPAPKLISSAPRGGVGGRRAAIASAAAAPL